MYRVADWTSYHSTTTSEVQDIMQACSANSLVSSPTHWPSPRSTSDVEIEQTNFIRNKILPAVGKKLGVASELQSVSIRPLCESDENRPHARFSKAEDRVSIYLNWSGTPADAICLAHEMGHAAHYIMSRTNGMPPVLRETCAFLGELIVLDELFETEDALFAPLRLIWDRENQNYLGEDLVDLQQALGSACSTYNYRWNYPLARLAAVQIFQAHKTGTVRLSDIFASGTDGMKHLPLDKMARYADLIENYLPPFNTNQEPPTAAYQSLGAMALLDIDTIEGPSERKIREVYAGLLKNLQDQTAFIALREDRRPIGYATWDAKPDSNKVTITHQSAPFGDHLKLVRTLQHRFADTEAVSAISQRSARKEQLAW